MQLLMYPTRLQASLISWALKVQVIGSTDRHIAVHHCIEHLIPGD